MKTIAVDEKTWRRLKEMREKLGTQSYNELINLLIERWHMTELKETVDEIKINVSPEMVMNYISVRKKTRGRTQK